MFSHLVSATFPMGCWSFRSIDLPTALNPQTFRDCGKTIHAAWISSAAGGGDHASLQRQI